MRRKLAIIGTVIILSLVLISCGSRFPAQTVEEIRNQQPGATPSAVREPGEQDSFLVKVQTGPEIRITVEELKHYPALTVETELVKSDGSKQRITARGAALRDILKAKGTNLDDFSALKVRTRDGYSVQIPGEVLKNRQVILAYEYQGKPVTGSESPIRIIVPGEPAMYWVRSVETIELAKNAVHVSAQRVMFMDSCGLKPSEYPFDGKKDLALPLKDVLAVFSVKQEGGNFIMKASDGLQKVEDMANVLSGYIKVTGDRAPEFVSPNLPAGMYVRNLLWFGTESEVIIASKKSATAYFKKEAVSLGELFKEVRMPAEDHRTYLLKGADGYTVEVQGGEIKYGIVSFVGPQPRVQFEGRPRSLNVKDLLEIRLR